MLPECVTYQQAEVARLGAVARQGRNDANKLALGRECWQPWQAHFRRMGRIALAVLALHALGIASHCNQVAQIFAVLFVLLGEESLAAT